MGIFFFYYSIFEFQEHLLLREFVENQPIHILTAVTFNVVKLLFIKRDQIKNYIKTTRFWCQNAVLLDTNTSTLWF